MVLPENLGIDSTFSAVCSLLSCEAGRLITADPSSISRRNPPPPTLLAPLLHGGQKTESLGGGEGGRATRHRRSFLHFRKESSAADASCPSLERRAKDNP